MCVDVYIETTRTTAAKEGRGILWLTGNQILLLPVGAGPECHRCSFPSCRSQTEQSVTSATLLSVSQLTKIINIEVERTQILTADWPADSLAMPADCCCRLKPE